MPKRGYADVVESPEKEEAKAKAMNERMARMREAALKKREAARNMDPTKSMPLEEKIGRGTEKLAESDKRSLREQIRQDEESLAAANSPEGKLRTATVDVNEIKRRLERNKMIVGRDDDLTPKSGTERDRLAARAKELETLLVKEMPSKREMWPKQGSVEAQQAIRHNQRFQANYSDQCREWQDIQRKLNPDDPYAQSLELIRPD